MEENESTRGTIATALLHALPLAVGLVLSDGNNSELVNAICLGVSAVTYFGAYLFGRKKFVPAYESQGTRAVAEGGNGCFNFIAISGKVLATGLAGYATGGFL